MTIDALPVGRLREYLEELKPESRALLLKEIERAALAGTAVPGSDLILAALRPALRRAGAAAPERLGDPARLFFAPVEPFMVDPGPAGALPGRIERTSLTPLWQWLGRVLLPDETEAYSAAVATALLAGDEATAAGLARDFQDQAARAIAAHFDNTAVDERLHRRVLGQLGLPRAIDDLRTLQLSLAHRDAVSAIASRLPSSISNLGEEQVENILNLFRLATLGKPDLLRMVLVLLHSRLGFPWQLIRLAIQAAETDAAAKVAQSAFAPAVTIVLADIACGVEELRAALRRGLIPEAIEACKNIHDAIRTVRSEMDLSGDTGWSRQLASLRADISDLLRTELESMPGQVRRLLRPRPAREIAPGAVLDPADVAETEARIDLVRACRNYAGELAINQVAPRILDELQAYFDTGVRTLFDSLRGAGEAERRFRQSQVDAAIRLAGRLFGADYAALLAKAAVVAGAERKAARA